MYRQRIAGPRQEYRQRQANRVSDSPKLLETYPQLKSLTLELEHLTPEGQARNRFIKFTPNLKQAKSLFRVDCSNPDCVAGDYDLSKVLAQAVKRRRKTAEGEMKCDGWLNKSTIDSVRCAHILRYKLQLAYTD